MTTTVRKPGRPVKSKTDESFKPVLIHILSEGFTAFGHIWSVGQEIEIDETHYNETLDIAENSWVDTSEAEQIERWGAVKFGKGPSPVPNSLINYVEDFRTQRIPEQNTYSWFNAVDQSKTVAAKAEVARGRSIPSI